MYSKAHRLALLISAATVAFENGNPGWKVNADGNIEVDGSGNPIWVNADGHAAAVRGEIISKLNDEARVHRENMTEAINKLKNYEGPDGKLIDPAIAKKAVETVSKLDAKQLIEAGEVDKVRDQIKAEYTQMLSERENALNEAKSTISSMRIEGVFKGSEFVRDRVAVPLDMFEAAMRPHFKDEDGKLVAYDRSGNRLMSKKNVGEFADPSEALELLVDMHPQKDTILKPDTGGGSGNGGGGGARGQGRRVSRADFNAMDPMKQAELGQLAGKGEVTIYD